MVQFKGLIKCPNGCKCAKHQPPPPRVSLSQIVIARAQQNRRGNIHSTECARCGLNGGKHKPGCIYAAS